MSTRAIGTSDRSLPFHIERHRWPSAFVSTTLDLVRIGHSGQCFVLFPAVNGFAEEYLAAGFFDGCRDAIEKGLLQFFCLGCEYGRSWLNGELPPREKILLHLRYERYLAEEVFPLVSSLTSESRTNVAGAGFGAYVAISFALKHPPVVHRAIGLSGSYSIRPFLDQYYDDDCYFNAPLDFVPNISDEILLAELRKLEVTLCCEDFEPCEDDNRRLAAILKEKAIPCQFIRTSQQERGWELWKRNFSELVVASA